MWLESILKIELIELWYKNIRLMDWYAVLDWEIEDMIKINLCSRTANKVYINVWKFENICDFDNLYDSVYSINRNDYIDLWQNINVEAFSIKSTLKSNVSIQNIVKKSIFNNLWSWDTVQVYDSLWEINIVTIIHSDNLILLMNSSGKWLHHRWYKSFSHPATIKENLASAMIYFSWRKKWQPIYDFFCWSGTILFEAWMMALNIPPWIYRNFDFEKFKFVDNAIFESIKKDLLWKIDYSCKQELYWYDIDENYIEQASQLSYELMLHDVVTFQTLDFQQADRIPENSFILSNPPYGKRLQNDNLHDLYKKLIEYYENWNNKWCFITSNNSFFKLINRKNWKLRKVFNGWEQCHFYKKL